MRNLILPFLLILTLMFSCRSESDEMLEKNVNSVDLYVAGAENNQACYWKNGQKVILSNGTGLYASQIIVENNNVYVYGAMTSEYILNLPSKHLYLWINGTKHNLDEYLEGVPNPSPNNYFQISSRMIVQNGNIYFCGSITDSSIPSQTIHTYYYWKNGLKFMISNDTTVTFPAGYQLINNEIYLGIRKNYQYNPLTWETGFYKNNIYFPLTNDSQIEDFYTDNTGIYAYIKNILTGEKTLTNINTNATIPLPLNPPSEILDIIWIDNDKYYIGDNFYYKNNTLVQLNDPNGYNRIRGFNVKNQQIYTIRYKDGPGIGILAKVFINDVEVQSQSITAVSDPNVGGLLSIYID